MKAVVIVGFAVLLGVFAWGATGVKVAQTSKDLSPTGSYLAASIATTEELFKDIDGEPFHIVFPELEYNSMAVQDGILAALANVERLKLVNTAWGATGTHCWIKEYIVNWLPANTEGLGVDCAPTITDGRTTKFYSCVDLFLNQSKVGYFTDLVGSIGIGNIQSPRIYDNGNAISEAQPQPDVQEFVYAEMRLLLSCTLCKSFSRCELLVTHTTSPLRLASVARGFKADPSTAREMSPCLPRLLLGCMHACLHKCTHAGTYYRMPWFDDVQPKNGANFTDGISSSRCFAAHSRYELPSRACALSNAVADLECSKRFCVSVKRGCCFGTCRLGHHSEWFVALRPHLSPVSPCHNSRLTCCGLCDHAWVFAHASVLAFAGVGLRGGSYYPQVERYAWAGEMQDINKALAADGTDIGGFSFTYSYLDLSRFVGIIPSVFISLGAAVS